MAYTGRFLSAGSTGYDSASKSNFEVDPSAPQGKTANSVTESETEPDSDPVEHPAEEELFVESSVDCEHEVCIANQGFFQLSFSVFSFISTQSCLAADSVGAQLLN